VFLLATHFVPVLWKSLAVVAVYGAALRVLSLAVHHFVEELLRRWISRRLAGKGAAVLA